MPKPTRRVELTPTRRTELAERYAHLDLTPKRGEKRRKPLQTVSAASLPRRRTHWLWDHRIPEGALTIVAGLEDRGKSLVVTRVVEQLGHGTLPGDWAGEPAKALIVCREDGHDETSRRLEAAGADLALVEYIVEPSDVDERGRYVRRRQGRHELEPLPDFHALRHTAAMACDDAEEARDLLRHKTSNVTRAVYRGHFDDRRREQLRTRLEARSAGSTVEATDRSTTQSEAVAEAEILELRRRAQP